MSNQLTAQRAYYPVLDVLRGIAILVVVFYHNFASLSFFRFGWMGVDLFFVLSGYLITELLLRSRDQKFYFRNFYVRRVLRIFPLYYLVLLVFFAFSPYIFVDKGVDSTFHYYNDHKIWYWGYIQNWLMVTQGPPPVPYLAHFWSLAIEEQFYLFWPLLIYIIRKPQHLKWIIYVLITVAMISRIVLWLDHPAEVETYYCNTFTRMDSLLMGSLLAIHLQQGLEVPRRLVKASFILFALVVTLSLLLFGNVKQNNAVFPTVGYTVSAAFFTAVLYLLLKYEGRVAAYLQHLRSLRFFGKISYGMYVYHIPIYLLLTTQVAHVLESNFNLGDWLTPFISALSIVLTIIASTLSFYVFEKPILQLKKHFP